MHSEVFFNQGIDIFRYILIFGLALVAAYLVIKLIEFTVPAFLRFLPQRQGFEPQMEKDRVQTFFNVASAVTKGLIIVTALIVAYQLSAPTHSPIGIIGASAFFVVLAGATISPILRDLTAGIVMIAEQWYNVGDHVAIEPFNDTSGVVEKITLRSTKLRALSGEVVWVHNQHIQSVKVTPRGVRTIAIDVYVDDLKRGERILKRVIQTLPAGPTMVARQLAIVDTEQLGDSFWRIMAVGQTAPGREWLLEDFALKAIEKYDGQTKAPTLIHSPIVHYADAAAEYRFKRSIKAKN